MVQFASYLRPVLCKTRLIFPRINGPNLSRNCKLAVIEVSVSAEVGQRNICTPKIQFFS